MLTLVIPPYEIWDSKNNEFRSSTKETILCLEHSLVSISKWESKWKKPFLSKEQKTREQLVDYIRCMTITQNVKDEVYYSLTTAQYNEINAYIESPQTATTFSSTRKGNTSKREVLTSEVIYYWMISYDIPFECQKWHLNRLLTLIRVCNIKGGNQEKMSKRDVLANNRALNTARRNQLKSKG